MRVTPRPLESQAESWSINSVLSQSMRHNATQRSLHPMVPQRLPLFFLSRISRTFATAHCGAKQRARRPADEALAQGECLGDNLLEA